MSKHILIAVAIVSVTALCAGCAHNRALHSSKERQMTLGLVQKEIRQGMDQASVAAALGSPNIVTRDASGREAWIYDKVATESSFSESTGNVAGSASAAGIAGDVLVGGKAGGSYGRSRGASATTQKTLTVIIRFDANGNVETYTYNASTF
jgi:outer membrane protein assembly factor BamE (lipoprotein component of BamABCDE complex)